MRDLCWLIDWKMSFDLKRGVGMEWVCVCLCVTSWKCMQVYVYSFFDMYILIDRRHVFDFPNAGSHLNILVEYVCVRVCDMCKCVREAMNNE